MIELQNLTIGQVSGIIAAAVFIVQFLVPLALPIILLGLLLLGSPTVTETAVSWSVIGRFLHSSYWPTILRTDSAASLSSCKSARFITFFRTFMLVLMAVAAIVTPLGLYDEIGPESDPVHQTFHYIEDKSTVGFGTPPRTNETGVWARICGYTLPYACPNSPNKLFEFENSTGGYIEVEGWYNSRIPQNVIDIFQSGLKNLEPTVSGPWDIQYRSYSKSELDTDEIGIPIDNGTRPYVKGKFRPLSSLILSDAIVPIEGLVVDMKNGGIGFRNHSAPPHQPYGNTWAEDILFITPETICVDTNLTLDFMIPMTTKQSLALGSNTAFRLNLTDHGGFVELNHTYPLWEKTDPQAHPDMWYRAYKAAWLSNALNMAFMNITNIANDTTRIKAFQYLNSTLNKTFPLHYPDGKTASTMFSIQPGALKISTNWGTYLDGLDKGISNISTIGNITTNYSFPSKEPLYANPFNITTQFSMNGPSNFSSAGLLCAGAGTGDNANITNMVSTCGLLYGAPRRHDGSGSIIFDPGSTWTLPMYSCMSAVKASIKTVNFRFNGSDDLSGLAIESSEDKVYPNEESKPLWAVENTDMMLKDGNPLWGIVTPEAATTLNISTLRKESLWLPGLANDELGILSSHQNLPGVDFYAKALSATYSGESTGDIGSSTDYTGQSNLAMYRIWQELSRESGSAAKILNLIWTDIALNMVVGTKGLDSQSANTAKSKRNESGSSNLRSPMVTSYTHRVRYKYAYGIPAFLVILLTTLTSASTLLFMLFGSTTVSSMRTFLQHTSAGRFLTSQTIHGGYAQASYVPLGQNVGYSNAPTDVWIEGAGRREFTLSAEGWMRNVHVPEVEYDEEGGTTASYAPVSNPNSY